MDNRLLAPGGNDYSQKIRAAFSGHIQAYYPLWETSGTTAQDIVGGHNGTYSGVTLGANGIGDGRKCPTFDGAASYVNILSAGLTAIFPAAAGTVMLWVKPDTANLWTDATVHQLFFFFEDASNAIRAKTDGAGNTSALYNASASFNAFTVPMSGASWQHLALTWNTSSSRARAYLNGAQSGADATPIGTWTGAAVTMAIGAEPGSAYWKGNIAHLVILDTEATATQIARAARV